MPRKRTITPTIQIENRRKKNRPSDNTRTTEISLPKTKTNRPQNNKQHAKQNMTDNDLKQTPVQGNTQQKQPTTDQKTNPRHTQKTNIPPKRKTN